MSRLAIPQLSLLLAADLSKLPQLSSKARFGNVLAVAVSSRADKGLGGCQVTAVSSWLPVLAVSIKLAVLAMTTICPPLTL